MGRADDALPVDPIEFLIGVTQRHPETLERAVALAAHVARAAEDELQPLAVQVLADAARQSPAAITRAIELARELGMRARRASEAAG